MGPLNFGRELPEAPHTFESLMTDAEAARNRLATVGCGIAEQWLAGSGIVPEEHPDFIRAQEQVTEAKQRLNEFVYRF